MKTLTLSPSPKNETLALEVNTDRICSFCGEGSAVCGKTVQGAYKEKSTTQKTERRTAYVVEPFKNTTLQKVPTGTQRVTPLFREPYTKVIETEYAHVLNKDLLFEHAAVLKDEYETREYCADICFFCIHQLAKLVPKV